MEALVWPFVVAAALVAFIVVRGATRPPWREPKDYLIAPPAFWAAPEWVRAACCNGAGPNGLVGWFVPEHIWGVLITEAANVHDWMYVWHTKPGDKETADAVFLINLIRLINNQTTRCPVVRQVMLWLRHRRALTYYEAVCNLGTHAFTTAPTVRPAGYTNPDLPKEPHA